MNAKPPQDRSLLQTILFSFGPTLLIIGLLVFFLRRAAQQAGGGGMLGQFGRSKARRAEGGEDTRVNFTDVAGIDEAKEELSEIVDFLKRPEKYQKLGARIPRGVLLSGQPGTGKTLLAKAVAGEAAVPFFSISASEFIEAIVGIGASRVRDLFQQAKDAAPAIIFIDELDAIGRSRSAGGGFSSGGHDEREQTLNQILTEMDGFETGDGVVVLAATNRPEILDKALLRAGRFDRRVSVQTPDKVGREMILKVHTRSVPLADGVDLQALAAATPGMVGADLANVVNEAALIAAKREHAAVRQGDLTDALEKIVLGTERNVVQTEEDRRRIAYHEGGHAIVGMLTPGADPVRKVSIIPRGQALGVTMSAPDADVFNYEESYLRGKIKVALGGRVAEELAFGTITTGAESDIQQATQIARGMVGEVGHERPDRLRGRAGRQRRRAAAARRQRDLGGHPAAGGRRGAADHRGGAHRGAQPARARARQARRAGRGAAARRDAGRARRLPRRRDRARRRAGVSARAEDLVATALAEDVGAGDLTVAAVVPRGCAGARGDQPEGAGRDLRAGCGARGLPPGRRLAGLRGAGPRGRVARGRARWRPSRAPPARS